MINSLEYFCMFTSNINCKTGGLYISHHHEEMSPFLFTGIGIPGCPLRMALIVLKVFEYQKYLFVVYLL